MIQKDTLSEWIDTCLNNSIQTPIFKLGHTMKYIKILFLMIALFAISGNLASADYGKRKGAINHRIIGGNPAQSDAYPWMTALISKTDNEQFCGGSLIAERWVLTAAHCVESDSAGNIQAYIGGTSLTDRSDGEVHDISYIHTHSEYGEDHDIALLQLATPSSKRPISTASIQFDDGLADDTNLLVTGWGLTTNNEDASGSINLLQVDVPLRNHEQCKANYLSTDEITITDNMICAGSTDGTRDSCNGDSGGPLMVRDSDNNLQLLGIVSFGSSQGCASATHPGVYTRVSRYQAWLDGKMNGITASPSTLALGYTGVGLGTTKTVTLVNNSRVSQVIQSAVITGDAEFTIVTDECQQNVLEPGAKCSVDVRFISLVEGSKEASLSFSTTNDITPVVAVHTSAESLPSVDLGMALDNSDLTWFSGGDSPWRIDASESHGYINGNAAISGAILDNQISVLHSQVTGPGTLSFRWRSSTEAFSDPVVFHIDDRFIALIDGETDWTDISENIPEGTHNLTWVYVRDQSNGAGANAGYLDQLRFLTSGNNNIQNYRGGGGGAGNYLLGPLMILLLASWHRVFLRSKYGPEARAC
ncbi:MAG: trypsin-like serine protease [Candidatus Thiodiazotropha sp.]